MSIPSDPSPADIAIPAEAVRDFLHMREAGSTRIEALAIVCGRYRVNRDALIAAANAPVVPPHVIAARAARAALRADALDCAARILRDRASALTTEARNLRREHGLICDACGGTGRSYGMHHDYPCDACGGSGHSAGVGVDSDPARATTASPS